MLPASLHAVPISYVGTSFAVGATLGSNQLTCSPPPPNASTPCVQVTITFNADTSTIVPFNVVGANPAAGLENFIGTGTVFLDDFQTNQSFTASFLDGQIYVSVDQTNGGVGFGSTPGGPTYPLGTYAGTPSTPYLTWDLASNFNVQGFSWFCPSGCALLQQGPALSTNLGALTITPTGPVVSLFSATVQTPEPATFAVIAAGLLLLLIARRKSAI